jgi:hypothetical protein
MVNRKILSSSSLSLQARHIFFHRRTTPFRSGEDIFFYLRNRFCSIVGRISFLSSGQILFDTQIPLRPSQNHGNPNPSDALTCNFAFISDVSSSWYQKREIKSFWKSRKIDTFHVRPKQFDNPINSLWKVQWELIRLRIFDADWMSSRCKSRADKWL